MNLLTSIVAKKYIWAKILQENGENRQFSVILEIKEAFVAYDTSNFQFE